MSKKVEVTVETISPKTAREWLEFNTRNRKPKPTIIGQIKRAIAKGRWLLNGAAIVFSASGVLLDGQNRLMAIAAGTKSVRSVVVRNAETRAQYTMDTGAKRTLGDTFRINEIPNANQAAAVTSIVFKKLGGKVPRARYIKGGAVESPTIEEGLELYSEHGTEIQRSVREMARVARAVGMSNSVLGFLHWEFSSIDREDADYFFGKLLTGESLEPDDPILKLRNLLVENLARPGHLRHSPTMLLGVATKAWNYYRRREPISRLYLRASEKMQDPI